MGAIKIYCKNCKFYHYGINPTHHDSNYYGVTVTLFPSSYCVEPHEVYVDSALDRIDESDNCFVKNKGNCCKYFKEKERTKP